MAPVVSPRHGYEHEFTVNGAGQRSIKERMFLNAGNVLSALERVAYTVQTIYPS